MNTGNGNGSSHSEHKHHHHHHHHHRHHNHRHGRSSSRSSRRKKNRIFWENLLRIGGGSKGKLKTAPYLVSLLIILIIFAVILGFYKEKLNKIEYENTKKSEEYEKQLGDEDDVRKVNTEKYGIYYKLREGLDVNGVIIGDETGLSYGVSDSENSWKTTLEKNLRAEYGSNVLFEQESGIGLNTIEGIMNISSKELDYDVAVICLGKNDDTEYFTPLYEALIHRLKAKSNMEIISVIGSDFADEQRDAIKNICGFYGTAYVDINEEIEESKYKKESLFSNSLPNDLCYEIYSESINEVISNNVKIQKELTKAEGYFNEQTAYFDTMNEISLGSFRKEGNRYITQINSPYAVVLFNSKKGGSDFTIYLNGEKVKSISVNSTYEIMQAEVFACGLEGENEVAIEVDESKPLTVQGIVVGQDGNSK